MSTAIFYHPLFLEHDPGFDHVERADRLRACLEAVDRHRDRYLFPEFTAATDDQILANHTAAHLARIRATSGRAYSVLDPDTRTSPQSYDAARLAAGSVVRGVELLMAGDIANGFALVRPPGHHAEADRAMGFCLFNNVAIGARHGRAACGCRRVAIVDWDLHHGNGTQHSFAADPTVLYCSIHQYPHYPGTGALPETGDGPGEGTTVNVPLPGGQGDLDYAGIFNGIIAPVLRRFAPDLILVSAGFDAHERDPLGAMRLTARGFAYLARVLLAVAAEVCGGRILFCLEGGYSLTGLRESVAAVLDECTGHSCLPEDFLATMTAAAPGERLQQQARALWGL